jgi:hypothetical protein
MVDMLVRRPEPAELIGRADQRCGSSYLAFRKLSPSCYVRLDASLLLPRRGTLARGEGYANFTTFFRELGPVGSLPSPQLAAGERLHRELTRP